MKFLSQDGFDEAGNRIERSPHKSKSPRKKNGVRSSKKRAGAKYICLAEGDREFSNSSDMRDDSNLEISEPEPESTTSDDGRVVIQLVFTSHGH
jgi:hypothetical protein